jgi:hypothetical protein
MASAPPNPEADFPLSVFASLLGVLAGAVLSRDGIWAPVDLAEEREECSVDKGEFSNLSSRSETALLQPLILLRESAFGASLSDALPEPVPLCFAFWAPCPLPAKARASWAPLFKLLEPASRIAAVAIATPAAIAKPRAIYSVFICALIVTSHDQALRKAPVASRMPPAWPNNCAPNCFSMMTASPIINDDVSSFLNTAPRPTVAGKAKLPIMLLKALPELPDGLLLAFGKEIGVGGVFAGDFGIGCSSSGAFGVWEFAKGWASGI